MFEALIQSHDVCVSLRTDDSKVIKYISSDSMPKAHIPGFNITYNKDASWQIIHNSKKKSKFECSLKNHEIIINGEYERDTSKHDLTFILLTIFSLLHEKKGRLIFHSGAVSSDKNSYIFMGRRGGGKSILVTELVYKCGMSLISGENTLVENNMVISGTSILSNRIPCITQRYPELILLPPYAQVIDNYDIKVNFPEHLIKRSFDLPKKISNIFMISVDDNYRKMYLSKPSESALIYELLSNSNAYSAGLGHTIMNFSIPHPNFDNYGLRQQRLNQIIDLIANNKILEIKGSIGQISNYLMR